MLAGRYELGARLGQGGMADVYRGVDHVLGRQVAVKVLRETTDDESDRARFVIEARTLARLSHPGLVTVLDAGIGLRADDAGPDTAPMSVDQPFLVMELVDGPTLAQVLADGGLEPAELQSIGTRLAEALAYVHAQGVVHRDVKPANVLLDCERSVKLTDFGIVRLLGDNARHTGTNQMIGTAAYLAPEQVTGQPVTPATDVYSLGLLLLEASTGERVYPGTALESALARLHQPPRIPDELPAAWRELLGRMTAIDPGARPSAAEVAVQLSAGTIAPASVASGAVFDPPTAELPVPFGRTHEPAVRPSPAPALAGGTGRRVPRRWLALGAPAAVAAAVAAVALASPLGADAGSPPETATQQPVAELPADDAPSQEPAPAPDNAEVALTSESSSERADAPVSDAGTGDAPVADQPTGASTGGAEPEKDAEQDETLAEKDRDEKKSDEKSDERSDEKKPDEKKPDEKRPDKSAGQTGADGSPGDSGNANDGNGDADSDKGSTGNGAGNAAGDGNGASGSNGNANGADTGSGSATSVSTGTGPSGEG